MIRIFGKKIVTNATRLEKIHRHGSRSKYIVKPENVLECGNHNIWLYRMGKRQIRVNETLGLSHHYRQGNCTTKPNMIIKTKTKKLSIFWNYLALICKAEIPYPPPVYLNHKILFTISLTTGSASMEDTPAPRRSLSLTPEHIIGPGGCCLQSPGIVEKYLEFKVVLRLLLLGHRIRDYVRF